jgi:hypothetical protein
VIESAVDDAVRLCRPAAQAFEVFERAAMRVCAGCEESLGSCVRTGEPENLMAGVDEFRDDG